MQISQDMKESFLKVNTQIEDTYTLVEGVVEESTQEEKMIAGMNDLIQEISVLSLKNSEVAKNTDTISNEILTIARELQSEVDLAKEKVEG